MPNIKQIKVKGKLYDLPSGGEGTPVSANPEEEATEELTKIQVDDTVYSIPESGGVDVELEDDMLVFSGGSGGKSSEYHEYSTEEKVVGKWIDGKPIYEITSEIINIPSAGIDTNYIHNLGVKEYINFSGICSVNGGTSMIPFPYIQNGADMIRIYSMDSNSLGIRSTWSNNKVILTIQYTKTTD